MAELLYGFAHAPTAALNFFLKGKTPSAMLSSSWYGNRCYRSYWECEYILKHRTHWEDELARANFECTLKFVRGCIALGMSNAPKFVRKFMHLFGYASNNESNGIADIEAAARYKECIAHPMAVISLFGWKAIVEPFLGKQLNDPLRNCYTFSIHSASGNEGSMDQLSEVLEAFSENTYGGLHHLIVGGVELIRGNVEASIECQRKAFPTLRCIGKTYLVCYMVNMINYK